MSKWRCACAPSFLMIATRDRLYESTESQPPSVTVVDPDKEFPGLKQNIDYLRVDYIRERSYEFDHVYGPTQPTDTVFQEAVELLIGPVLDGQNVTIFVYGQTGW